MPDAFRRSAVLTLAAIVGLVPLAVDMFLPSLPGISGEFSAPVWLTQLTLTGYILILGVGQLVAGPVSDAFGRRRPLLVGLVVFTIGSLLAAVAPSLTVLIVARAVQGVGGAVALVVVNSAVRDVARGKEATRLYAVLLTVSAAAPILAPAAGGVIDAVSGWRSVFVVLALIGAGVTAAAALLLPESLPRAARTRLSLPEALVGYRRTLRLKGFLMPLLVFALVYMALFTYIGGASHVYQGVLGMTPLVFGLVFGASGSALLVGASAAGRLSGRLEARSLAGLGIAVTLVGGVGATLALLVHGPAWAVVLGMAVALAGVGVCEPALMSLSMSAVSHGAGAAAAVLGATQFVLGAAATGVTGEIAAASPVGWGLALSLLAFASLLLVVLSGDRRRAARPAVQPLEAPGHDNKWQALVHSGRS